MKALCAVLLAFTLGLAPLLAVGAELLTPPACPIAQNDCCAKHSGKSAQQPARNTCADCAMCTVNCCTQMLVVTDQLLVPPHTGARWRNGPAENGLQRTYPPPLPPPRTAGA